jgi:hypothetical protein
VLIGKGGRGPQARLSMQPKAHYVNFCEVLAKPKGACEVNRAPPRVSWVQGGDALARVNIYRSKRIFGASRSPRRPRLSAVYFA